MLESGTKLGPYEILAPIGAGGMGEVYKAKDTRLDRIVAVKVLPEHLSANVELKKRFEQEARAISSLNHPNICVLYDIGHEEGIDFMVMEYIEGETLAERLQKGALPLDEVLQHAIGISDALDKAHRRGVVHRDLKPGNIISSSSGPKLLDFGLAKIFNRSEPGSALSSLATEAKPLTKEGTILGTFQYMAPEQLESKDTDGRTDVFAFGAVLYEMLTGRKAFRGESQASLITAIMSSEPEAVTDLVPMTPPALDRLVQRCLAKDPDKRWQSAGDVTLELEWILDRPERPAPETPRSAGRWKERIAWALGVAIASLSVYLLTRPDPPRVMRFTTEVGQLQLSNAEIVKITPDGTTLVYVGERDGTRQVFRRSLDEIQATPLPGTEGAASLFVSPDGDRVGFMIGGFIKTVPLGGGPAASIVEVGGAFRGFSWGDDGAIVYGIAADGLWRVPDTGGEPERMTEAPAGRSHVRPFHLPDSKGLLFTDWSSEDSWIAVLPAGSHEPRKLVPGTAPRLAPSGHLVFQRGGSLWAVAFDLDRLDVDGAPVPVIEGVEVTGSGAAQYDIARDGTLSYVPASDDTTRGRRIDWVDRGGVVTMLVEDTTAVRASVAPDGNRILFYDNAGGLWVFDVERRSRSVLVSQRTMSSVWSLDGERIAYKFTGDLSVRSIASDGSGEEEVLYEFEGLNLSPQSWSSDGRILAMRGESDIWIMPVGGEPERFLETPASETQPMFSPDGGYLAYVSDESGRDEVQVQTFPDPGRKWVVSVGGGTSPVWSRDGSELFYRSEGRLMVVDLRTEPTFSAGTPRVLLDAQQLAAYRDEFDVSPDGQRFLFVENVTVGEKRSLVVVLNWTEELKRLVPTN